jgi:hypothetical protein
MWELDLRTTVIIEERRIPFGAKKDKKQMEKDDGPNP